MRKILCVTAHPDDEAGGFGGSLARYARQGVECRLVCLTAGGAARNRGQACDAEELKQLRRGELAASCKLLGIHMHEVWDLPDAGLPRVNFHEVAERLARVIREYRPDIVMCFGPEGSLTAHFDHGMAGALATTAFHWAGQERFLPEGPPAYQAPRLFYATMREQPPIFPPVLLPVPDVSIDVAEFLEIKIAAFRAHTTQIPLADRFEAFIRIFGDHEMFHLAACKGPFERNPDVDGDLFQGMPE